MRIKLTAEQVVEYLRRTQGELGAWQWEVILGNTNIRQLKGTAKDWSSKYHDSFNSLIRRLNAAGIEHEYAYGPRGGFLYGLNPDSYRADIG